MIPFDLVIWDAGECADYLHVSRPEFLRKTRYAEGFPQELPTRPRHWRAVQVVGWALGENVSGFTQSMNTPSGIKVPSSAPELHKIPKYIGENNSPF